MSSTPSVSEYVDVVDNREDRPANSRTKYRVNLSKTESCQDLYEFVEEKIKTKDFKLCFDNWKRIKEKNYNKLKTGDLVFICHGSKDKRNSFFRIPVNIAPHPDTITKSGMYEYYDSRGIDSVVISIAELIDNSLSATKNNKSLRLIDIRYYDNGKDSMVVIIDNGHGMNRNDLNNWAKFKCSKFVRNRGADPGLDETFSTQSTADSANASFISDDLPLRTPQNTEYLPRREDYRPRYLDSEINYFGAGGKQAIFNIGNITTMITKTVKSDDVFELTLSKKKFDDKYDTKPDSVYKEEIIQRKIGTDRNKIKEFKEDSDSLEDQIITFCEKSYKSFTICCIKDVHQRHNEQLSTNSEAMTYWTKGLARIYHYYLHGPNGNTGQNNRTLPPELSELKDIKIIIKVITVKSSEKVLHETPKYTIDLSKIDDDFETLLVRSAADTFEFRIERSDKLNSTIEGIVRYHPYLHDHETLPQLKENEELGETVSQISARTEDLEDDIFAQKEFRSRTREVFECFWHGRLIPQDCIDFDWNKFNPKHQILTKDYEECFNRLSGALFTNCGYQVSQNKQSFMDLSKQLSNSKKHNLTFFRLDKNGRRVRKEFESDFANWVIQCHRKYDKQIQYLEYQRDMERKEFTPLFKKKCTITDIFSIFNAINWRNRIWKKGDIIETQNTRPQKLIGKIDKFLVPLKCNGDYVGSPGYIEIHLLPAEIYGMGGEASKVINFSKVNTEANEETINNELQKSYDRLPHGFEIKFPEGFAVKAGDALVAGTPIGAISIKMTNKKGELLTTDRIKNPFKNTNKRLRIQMEILKVEKNNETISEIQYEIANYSKDWKSYWFTKHEGIKKIGKYRIQAVCLTTGTDNEIGIFANGKSLPYAEPIDFTVIPGPPKSLVITDKNPRTQIGKPMDLTLQLFDEFKNIAKPDISNEFKVQLAVDTFNVSFQRLESINNKIVIKDIIIKGIYNPNDNPNPMLVVSIPSMNTKHEVLITLQTGIPSQISLTADQPMVFMNGTVPLFGVLVLDGGGNDVTFNKRNDVFCRIYEQTPRGQVPVTSQYSLDQNMFRDKRCLVLNKEFSIKGNETEMELRKFVLKFQLKTDPNVSLDKEIIVKKSTKPTSVKICFDYGSGVLEMPNEKPFECPAGSALSGVHFKAYNSDGTDIDLCDYQDLAVDISWFDKPIPIKATGALPNIQFHKEANVEKIHRFSWKEPQKGIDIIQTFKLKPYPDSPQRMEIKPLFPLEFPIGQVVSNAIHITIYDAFNNIFRGNDIVKELTIKSVSQLLVIDEKTLKIISPQIGNLNNVSIVVSNIKLMPNESNASKDSLLGKTRLEFVFKNTLNESLDIDIVNGPPNSIQFINVPKNLCFTAKNNKKFQLTAQLLDEYNNNVIRGKHSISLVFRARILQKELTAKPDETGKAVFSEKIQYISEIRPKCEIPSELRRDLQPCSTKCCGIHKFNAIVRTDKKDIKTEDHWLHIHCDNTNPVQIEIRCPTNLSGIMTTQKMPPIFVRLLAEGNTFVQDFDIQRLEMHLSKGRDFRDSQKFEPIEKETNESVRFAIDSTPPPNKYFVKFIWNGITKIERIYEKEINVIPGPPHKLMLRSEPLSDPIVVSNFGTYRHILKSTLILDIVDSKEISIYENISESDLNKLQKYSGILRTRIVRNDRQDSDERQDIPELENCDQTDRNKCRKYVIRRGRIEIPEQELCLKENTSGANCGLYSLIMTPELNNKQILEDFIINIMFCDDSGRQEQLTQIQTECYSLEKERKSLTNALEELQKLVKNQTIAYKKCISYENEIKNKLKEAKELSELTDEKRIDSKIKEYENKVKELKAEDRKRIFRGIRTVNTPKGEDIMGTLADLAFISDDLWAKRISWFLSKHMNCVITRTIKAAEKLVEENGIQSTLALDRLPKDCKFYDILPHQKRNPTNSRVTPVFPFVDTIEFAKYKFKVADNDKDLMTILSTLLGNTLTIDTLVKAELYRKRFEKHEKEIGSKCPTIITKEGILYDNGIVDLSGPTDDDFVSFQLPPNEELIRAKKVSELLKRLLKETNNKAKEEKSLKELEEKYNSEKNEKLEKIRSLEDAIRSGSSQFTDISNADLMDISLNQSIQRSKSVDSRRRSSNHSQHSSPERHSPTKRFRRAQTEGPTHRYRYRSDSKTSHGYYRNSRSYRYRPSYR